MLPPLALPSPLLPLPIHPLAPTSFALFGTVIQNPFAATTSHQSWPPSPLPANATPANQNTAIKLSNITDLTDHYPLAPSGRPARVSVSMFVCAPRGVRRVDDGAGGASGVRRQRWLLDVPVLERHPYTSQTFSPLGLGADESTGADGAGTVYLVIVAPTLDDPNTDTAPPPSSTLPRGRGLPDLARARAFVARGDQAVTYAPGTWHAPMVVLGGRAVGFVVMQFANGVAGEDCEEVEIGAGEGGVGFAVDVTGAWGVRAVVRKEVETEVKAKTRL